MHELTRAELQAVLPPQIPRLQPILDAMAARGTVQTYREAGQANHYALLPSAKGWFDTPYWAGRETEDTRRLALLWLQNREEASGEELARGDMPTFRIVPVALVLKHDPAILPLEELRPRIEAQSIAVVSWCPCRQIKSQADQGMGREVSTAETLEIARACEEEELAHCVENIDGYLGTLCNCCGLCSAHCPEKAVTLMLRRPENPPPDLGIFLERKLTR